MLYCKTIRVYIDCTNQRSLEYNLERNVDCKKSRYVHSRLMTFNMSSLFVLIPLTRPPVMLGPAGRAMGQRDPRPAAPRVAARLRCDSDTTVGDGEGDPPWRGRLAASGPTWARLARQERTCDSDDSERAGGEEAAARATTSQAKTSPANSPSYHHPHAADVKASSTGAGVVPCGGEGTRRYAIDAWSEQRVPALDTSRQIVI